MLGILFFPFAIRFLNKRLIHDKPNERKIHKEKKTSMGGAVIFLISCLTFLLYYSHEEFVQNVYVILAIVLVVIIGVIDDLYTLRARQKLIGLLPAVFLIVYVNDIRITSFYGLFGVSEITDSVSFVLTMFTIIALTNAFNLIDGIDGLAGTIAFIAFVTLGIGLFYAEHYFLSSLLFVFAGSIMSFLCYNWMPSKIFMGDTGALLLGFILTISLIVFIESNHSTSVPEIARFNNNVTAAICIIILPFFDTLRVFILRVVKGESPFSPDTNHTHHLLLRLGYSHAKATILLSFVTCIFILIAYLFREVEDNVLFYIIFVLGVLKSLILHFAVKLKGKKDNAVNTVHSVI